MGKLRFDVGITFPLDYRKTNNLFSVNMDCIRDAKYFRRFDICLVFQPVSPSAIELDCTRLRASTVLRWLVL